MHSHRSTLKQTNKTFKSKHASKGSIKQANKGKVNRSSVKQNQLSKEQKRNQLKALQQTKRLELLANQRLFNGYLYLTKHEFRAQTNCNCPFM